jgi:hypothetical protein
MIDQFIAVGFELYLCGHSGSGWVNEYKYYPPHLSEFHYELVLFTKGYRGSVNENTSKTEYRLYKFDDVDEDVTEYHVRGNSEENFIRAFNEYFMMELRDIRINEILK